MPESGTNSEIGLDRLYNHPAHLVRRSYQIFLSVFERELGEKGVTPTMLIIMAVLHEHPGIDLSTLAYAAAVDKSSCGRNVTRLEKMGVLKVARSFSDARQKVIFLTAEGRELLFACRHGIDSVETALLSVFSEEERKTFMDILLKFAVRNNELSRAPFRAVEDAQASQ